MLMKNSNRCLKFILLLLPAAIGMLGFLIDRSVSFGDAVYRCVTMYVINYTETPPNALVDIARWLAPIATTSGILLAVSSVNARVRAWLVSRRADSFAVYGDAAQQDVLLEQLGSRGIRGGDRLVRAGNYILAGAEQDNLVFYARHRAQLQDKPVYLRCSSRQTLTEIGANVKCFSPEELASRLFWKETFLYPFSAARGHRFSIALIGFGALGEELLYWGLQNNLFDPQQEITYHVFGDCSAFLDLHPGLKEIRDRVVPHDEPWHAAADVLQDAGLILVLEQERQFELLQKLLLLPRLAGIVCFSAQDDFSDLFGEGQRVRFFPWLERASRIENITEDRMVRLAKTVNLRYAHLYGGTEETEENLEAEWKALNTFTRYSNISAADYHEMRLRILEHQGLPPRFAALPAAVQGQMAELEHERWCRYHYLNNWSYGVPENGARKDPALRIHSDLVPYSALSEAERKKDYDTVGVMMSI